MKRIGCVGDNCVDHYRQTGEDHFGGNPVNVAVYARPPGGGGPPADGAVSGTGQGDGRSAGPPEASTVLAAEAEMARDASMQMARTRDTIFLVFFIVITPL